jgi:hypothetical protein
MSTEPHWVTKYREMLELQKKAEEAEKPFRELAAEIAREQDEMATGESIVFKEKSVVFGCRGTGIYSHDEWCEEFPVELLFERAATKMRAI